MKTKTKLLLLMVALLAPYMAMVLYMAFTIQGNTIPQWFVFAAPLYFVGSIALFVILRKRIIAAAAPVSSVEQNDQTLRAARAARRLGYIWWIGPFSYFASGGIHDPIWMTIMGLSWISFLSWLCFREARKLEAKAARNATQVPSS